MFILRQFLRFTCIIISHVLVTTNLSLNLENFVLNLTISLSHFI
jgi:hypothetical protein